MSTEHVVIHQTIRAEITITLDGLEEEIKGNRELLKRHKHNLLKLQSDKAIYAVGEDPLRLDNQIDEESRRIEGLKSLLREIFYRKLLHLLSLADLSAHDLALLYRQCRPKNLVKPLPQPETTDQLVHRLWQMRDIQDNETPILELVERLAKLRHTLPVEPLLQAWRNEVLELGLLKVQPAAMTTLQQAVHSSEDLNNNSALLVEIAPDPGATTDYLVRMYYWRDGVVDSCWHKQENDASGHFNRTYKLHEIPNLLYRVLSMHEEKPAAIEFLLPKELLAEAVDQWASDEDFVPVKFCSEHRIVIRSQERIAKRELSKWRQAWREKWQLFQEAREQRDIWWVEPTGTHELTTYAQRLIHAKEKATCLGLTFLPVHRATEQERSTLLIHILRAGVPVMAWSREHENAQRTAQHIRDELAAILCKEYLDNLPMIVHQMRTCQEVLDSAEHIGNRLALFWDDPERVPDAYRWQ